MKKNYTLTMQIILLFCFVSSICQSQVQSSNLVAKFGVDGDLYSDYRQNGTFTAAASQDWFKTTNNIGRGMIDTTGAATYKSQLSNGDNIEFTNGMAFPSYSVMDSILYMDARYGRDNFGISNGSDKTIFFGGAKNGESPADWVTYPSGGSVPDKVDIIDAYASIRRNGTNLSSNNPSHMIMYMGASTMASAGDRYIDFELFVNPIAYNPVNGNFTNSGGNGSGGHEPWLFNTDGSLKKIGDMVISFNFNSTTVDEIASWIWVSRTIYENLNPTGFDFVPNEFYGSGNAAKWGYAKISPKPGPSYQAWGSVNSGNINGPAWGTASKGLGSFGNSYFSFQYEAGQFAEAALDLTSLGIDPAFYGESNSCNSLYRRIMIKSRSSASFTSALQDFTGPYSFLDAPIIPASIKSSILTCSNPTAKLEPAALYPTAYYEWSKADGTIIARDTAAINISEPGKYYLTAAIVKGCAKNTDSIIIFQDVNKPKAIASSIGSINAIFSNTANLFGGDVAASEYTSSFSRSQGLLWQWSNAYGFSSAIQNPVTADTGWHQLVVTQISNGCTDTAMTFIPFNSYVLPVKLEKLTAVQVSNKNIVVKWTVLAEDGKEKYELERSENGVSFKMIYNVSSSAISTKKAYLFTDNIRSVSTAALYYRVKIILPSGEYQYSTTVKIVQSENIKNHYLEGVFQQSSASIQVNYFTKNSEVIEFRLIDINGRIMAKTNQQSVRGNNSILFNGNLSMNKNQLLLVQMVIGNEIYTQKIILL